MSGFLPTPRIPFMQVTAERDVARDLAGTAVLTMLGSASALAVVAVLARSLDEHLFFAFSVVTRYLAFLATAANLGMAFAFIRYSDGSGTSETARIARLGRRAVLQACAALACIWVIGVVIQTLSISDIGQGGSFGNGLGSSESGHRVMASTVLIALAFLWVVAQAQYHLAAPLARRIKGFRGYARLYMGSRITAPLFGAAAAVAIGRFEVFFIVAALFSLVAQRRLWKRLPSLAIATGTDAPPLLAFARSRWLEQLLRSALPVAFVAAAQWQGGALLAGSVALVYTVAKAVESFVQPLVVSLMMRFSTGHGRRSGLLISLLLATSLTALVLVGGGPIHALVELFLGARYIGLAEDVRIVLLGAGPIVALSLLRALNDNEFTHSPMLGINFVCLACVPVIVVSADTLHSMAFAIAGLQFLRYLLYCRALRVGLAAS